MIVDATGVPLAATVTGGNHHDVTQLIPLIEAIPVIRGRRSRPRRRPRYLLADRAYDHDAYRRRLTARQITPIIARRGAPHGSGLGRQRWPVERTLGWLHQFRRLRTRWERRADIHQAFLTLACSIICLRKLQDHSETRSYAHTGSPLATAMTLPVRTSGNERSTKKFGEGKIIKPP